MLKVNPPLYLIGKKIYCWHCQTKIPVVAILAPDVDDSFGDVCILTGITKLPASIADYIQGRVPSFKFRFSKTVSQKYYANTCSKCGYISGVFHLHSEPGAPFFPCDEKEAQSLFITEIMISEPIGIEASPGYGIGELILKNARKIA
jgi:hypothetical protein